MTTNKLKDISNITWSFQGRPFQVRDGFHYYTTAQVKCADGTSRIFQLGDCVYVDAGDGSGNNWVCQIVEMYSTQPPMEEDDEDFQVVHDTTANSRMRTVLRWLYHPNDIAPEAYDNVPPAFLGVYNDELYFSDHIEFDGNALEVIDGRAFLFQSIKELRSFQKNIVPGSDSPTGFWDGDKLHVVRYFYGTQTSVPPPIRELENKELAFLLSHPCTDAMYKKSRAARRGGFEPVLKGTGRKNTAFKLAQLRRNSQPIRENFDITTSTKHSTVQSHDISSVPMDGIKSKRDEDAITARRRSSDSYDRSKSPKRHSSDVLKSPKRKSAPLEAPKSPKRKTDDAPRRRSDSGGGVDTPKSPKSGSRLRRKPSDTPSFRRRELVEAEGIGGRATAASSSAATSPKRRVMEVVEAVGGKEKRKSDRRRGRGDVDIGSVGKQRSMRDKIVREVEKESMETNDEKSKKEVYNQLITSFARLSMKQQSYCIQNLDAHVQLIVQKMKERNVDFNATEAQKQIIAQDVVRELVVVDESNVQQQQ